jgi:hypothetical protein
MLGSANKASLRFTIGLSSLKADSRFVPMVYEKISLKDGRNGWRSSWSLTSLKSSNVISFVLLMLNIKIGKRGKSSISSGVFRIRFLNPPAKSAPTSNFTPLVRC